MFFEKMMNAYWSKKAGKKKGFTLIEMLVVIAIIATLTSIIIPTVQGSITKAAAATNASNLRSAKGEFSTLKLMNPEDYTEFTGGLKALTGIQAEDQKFTVGSTGLTVHAANSVEVKTPSYTTAKDTGMSAEIVKDYETGAEEVYVTYAGMPIAYYAAVAEFGDANPEDYLGVKGTGNHEANAAYIEKYVDRANTVISALKNAPFSDQLFGNLIKQMGDIATDVEGQGDCTQCAMNKLDTSNMGILGSLASDKVTSKLEQMGYDKNGQTKCDSYTPVDGVYGSECICGVNSKNDHGPQAHVSTTEKIGIGAGYASCPEGGLHEYQYISHECIKCGYQLDAGTCPVIDTSIPYLGQMLDGECMYCGYCDCCAAADGSNADSANYAYVGEGKGDYKKYGISSLAYYRKVAAGKGDYILVGGFDIPSVEGLTYDTGVCMSSDPLLGGKGKGCGHTAADHLRTFSPKS